LLASTNTSLSPAFFRNFGRVSQRISEAFAVVLGRVRLALQPQRRSARAVQSFGFSRRARFAGGGEDFAALVGLRKKIAALRNRDFISCLRFLFLFFARRHVAIQYHSFRELTLWLRSMRPRTTLKRARKDLASLKETIGKLQSGDHQEVVFGNQDPTGHVNYVMPIPLQDLSADIGVITGQLRAALDQLVHALFELRKGHPSPIERRLQFPICKKPQDFKARIKPDLEGLDIADIALIEKAQLYNGGHWLWALKLLAEEHKRRKLIYVKTSNPATIRAHFTGDPTDLSAFYLLPNSGVRAPQTMQVNTKITGPIRFADESPVIEKLEILKTQVTAIVDAFQPLFN
jgi:hypothetical protein